MPIDWRPFVDFIQGHERFLLTTHIRPDGDGIGSMQALALALSRLGKRVRCLIASVYPARYRFLDPDRQIERFTARETETEVRTGSWPLAGADAAIILDTGTWNQLGELGSFLHDSKAARAVIDHHQTQDDLGASCFVDTRAEATGRLAFEAINALEVPLDGLMARALFVALAMDTGWFRHSNTTAATFELAGRLVEAGARPETLYEPLFEENSLARLKLLALILSRLQVGEQGQIAFTELRSADYQATGATPQDSEDLVNYTRSVAGVEVGLFFMEQPRGGVKVSFRSRQRVDVAGIAEQFGGGGHRLASGAIIHAPLEQARAKVLDAVAAAIQNARPGT
jgi:phosphoesterase RecJ-like protein